MATWNVGIARTTTMHHWPAMLTAPTAEAPAFEQLVENAPASPPDYSNETATERLERLFPRHIHEPPKGL